MLFFLFFSVAKNNFFMRGTLQLFNRVVFKRELFFVLFVSLKKKFVNQETSKTQIIGISTVRVSSRTPSRNDIRPPYLFLETRSTHSHSHRFWRSPFFFSSTVVFLFVVDFVSLGIFVSPSFSSSSSPSCGFGLKGMCLVHFAPVWLFFLLRRGGSSSSRLFCLGGRSRNSVGRCRIGR